MRKIFFDTEFQFLPIVGADCANDIKDKWFEGEKLIEEYQFIVSDRGNLKLNCDWVKPPHKLINLNYDCSSTMFRDFYKTGEVDKARKYIHSKLWSSINRIYK